MNNVQKKIKSWWYSTKYPPHLSEEDMKEIHGEKEYMMKGTIRECEKCGEEFLYTFGRQICPTCYAPIKHPLTMKERLLCWNDKRKGESNLRKIKGIWLRTNTSDLAVLYNVYRNLAYDYLKLKNPKLIIDAGAHIGIVSMYLADRYPLAQIIALEPEESNYRLLCKNVNSKPNIYPVRCALWYEETQRFIHSRSNRNTSYNIIDNIGNPVPAASMPFIMTQFNFPRVDFLKMDIEGAEIKVLQNRKNWIHLVKVLSIEWHFKELLLLNDFNYSEQHGEMVTYYKGE